MTNFIAISGMCHSTIYLFMQLLKTYAADCFSHGRKLENR